VFVEERGQVRPATEEELEGLPEVMTA
jgi:hypothetical protein